MHIHFVCSGNTYRSRLAEAYLRSMDKKPNTKVSSSGIIADKSKPENGPVNWYTMRLMKRNDLIKYMSWQQTQTTQPLLE